jgi:pimeloyl-ACP methyl ester carboxylesterase
MCRPWCCGERTIDLRRFAPLDYAQTFVANLPTGRLETLADCGHRIYVDRPDAAASAIVKFAASAAKQGK